MTSFLPTSRTLPGVRLGCESRPHCRQAGLTLNCSFTSLEVFHLKWAAIVSASEGLAELVYLELSIQVQPGSLDGGPYENCQLWGWRALWRKQKHTFWMQGGRDMWGLEGREKAPLLRRGGVSSGNPCLDRTHVLTGSSAPAPLRFRWNSRGRERPRSGGRSFEPGQPGRGGGCGAGTSDAISSWQTA